MRKRIYLFALVALLAVALLAAGCGGSKDAPKAAGGDTIKIGFLGGKTGAHAHYGIETLKGMQMAVDDINKAGGVLGKKLEIVEGDHGSNSSEAANVTQKMITQKVVAIVGDPTTGITKTAAQICQPAKVVLLSAGAVGTGVVEIGDYIYRDTLLDAVAAPAVTKYLSEELKWKKVALVTTTGLSYSESLTAIFKPALAKYGVEIVAEQSIMEKDTNFSAQVTSLSQKSFDGVIFTGYYTEGALFMKEMRKQGLNQVMAGGDGLLGQELYQLGEKAVEGSMVYAGFAVDSKNAVGITKEFIDKYQAKNNNSKPDMFAAQGYDAVMMLAEAMKKANSADPTVFKEALAKTKDFKGVTGTITFDANREPIKSPVYLQEVKNSEFVVKTVIPTA
ncbi:ABC transporter substrate-binding protein [Pelotomaculum propionicicum]|uniref:Leucine-, isoleucine-, valine-, threonine-, and alanine-binding protein n=1 Tax=Pelotomaculum propionicicum TaxID=258475 RepID=A0A4Y7RZR0_9FIRM|nr:ABC transporter substrate-binding protein [Pelotomaculum propionicicum]NLI11202.1 ABC transporter substrate-binding protein [Peptococcaceae bacterium]TEB13767.1 Leucine-, isoleucine-, valine-, threonine-, and alanine-binding protein [Pelotomaculum propionicicum]